MIQGGTDADGTIIYVGRAFHEGDMVTGKTLSDISTYRNILLNLTFSQSHAR